MNCPQCQTEIPTSDKSNWGPPCGRDFHEVSRRPSHRAGLVRNYLRVMGLLTAPAIASMIAMKLESFFLLILGIGGSVAAGIHCARVVIWDYHITGIKAQLLQFGLALALSILSLTISYLGCSLNLGNS